MLPAPDDQHAMSRDNQRMKSALADLAGLAALRKKRVPIVDMQPATTKLPENPAAFVPSMPGPTTPAKKPPPPPEPQPFATPPAENFFADFDSAENAFYEHSSEAPDGTASSEADDWFRDEEPTTTPGSGSGEIDFNTTDSVADSEMADNMMGLFADVNLGAVRQDTLASQDTPAEGYVAPPSGEAINDVLDGFQW
jgi:hypothetical protein